MNLNDESERLYRLRWKIKRLEKFQGYIEKAIIIVLAVMVLTAVIAFMSMDPDPVAAEPCRLIDPVPVFELRQSNHSDRTWRYTLHMIDERGDFRVGHAYTDKPLPFGRSFEVIIVKPE